MFILEWIRKCYKRIIIINIVSAHVGIWGRKVADEPYHTASPPRKCHKRIIINPISHTDRCPGEQDRGQIILVPPLRKCYKRIHHRSNIPHRSGFEEEGTGQTILVLLSKERAKQIARIQIIPQKDRPCKEKCEWYTSI